MRNQSQYRLKPQEQYSSNTLLIFKAKFLTPNKHGFQTHNFWNFLLKLQYEMLIPFTMNQECVTWYHMKAAHL